MIIDARVRPPFRSLKRVLASAPGSRPPVKRSPLVSGYERPASMVQKSLDLFLQEMDEAAIDRGILVGRQAAHRTVSNDDIVELRDMYQKGFLLLLQESMVPMCLLQLTRSSAPFPTWTLKGLPWTPAGRRHQFTWMTKAFTPSFPNALNLAGFYISLAA